MSELSLIAESGRAVPVNTKAVILTNEAGVPVCFAAESQHRRIVACVNICGPIPTEVLEVSDSLEEVWGDLIDERDALRVALEAMKRCPGVWQTDQETGETFGNLIDAALVKTRGES